MAAQDISSLHLLPVVIRSKVVLALSDNDYQQNAFSNKMSQKSLLPIQNVYSHCRYKISAHLIERQVRLTGQINTS